MLIWLVGTNKYVVVVFGTTGKRFKSHDSLQSVLYVIKNSLFLKVWKVSLQICLWKQGSADSPYNTEIVLISPNEGKSLSKDF